MFSNEALERIVTRHSEQHLVSVGFWSFTQVAFEVTSDQSSRYE